MKKWSMADLMASRVREKTGPGAPKFCNHHQGAINPDGGRYIASDNGLTQRWICKSCFGKIAKQFDLRID